MILTIDIGLRNLAFCIMSGDKTDLSTYKIHLWDVFNTLDNDDYKCEDKFKNGNICGRKCTYKYTKINTIENTEQIIYCCKTHFPKTLKIESKHVFKKKTIDSYLLQDIAKIFIERINQIYNEHKVLFDSLTHIFIELQPKVNRKMVFTSHILYGKFVELYKDTTIPIRFVRASKKLLAYTGPEIICKLKGEYAKRKWLSIEYSRWFLENKFIKEQKEKWLPFFLSSTKADDLSDTLLMSINAIHGIPKKQLTNKKGRCIK